MVAARVDATSASFFVPGVCAERWSFWTHGSPHQVQHARSARWIFSCPEHIINEIKAAKDLQHVHMNSKADSTAKLVINVMGADYPDGICAHPSCVPTANASSSKLRKLVMTKNSSIVSLRAWRENHPRARIFMTQCRAHTSIRQAGALFRPGHDICGALRPVRLNSDASTAGGRLIGTTTNASRACTTSLPHQPRKYRLTFKGTIYGSGDGRVRLQLPLLHNPASGIVVQGRCRRSDSEAKSLLGRTCAQWNQTTSTVGDNYCDLLNTSFALVPDGRSTASIRLVESLGAGVVPLVLRPFHDADAPLPHAPAINWAPCTKVYTDHLLMSLNKEWTGKKEKSVPLRLRACLDIFREHFATRAAWQRTFFADLVATAALSRE